VELSFFWRSQRLDVLRFETPPSISTSSVFVSIHAPPQLARATKPFIEEHLRIVDDRGLDYAITVEPPTSKDAERYAMINGYVWRRSRNFA
jgi:hypothetical protein